MPERPAVPVLGRGAAPPGPGVDRRGGPASTPPDTPVTLRTAASSATTGCCSPPGPRRCRRVPGAELDGVVKLDDLDDARDIIRAAARRRTRWSSAEASPRSRSWRASRRTACTWTTSCARTATGETCCPSPSRASSRQELRRGGVRIHHVHGTGAHRRPRRPGGRRRDGRRRRDPLRPGGRRHRRAPAHRARPAPPDWPATAAILVDEYLRTSETDIFAAGDVAETPDPAPATARSRCCGTRRCTRAASPASTWPPGPVHAYEEGPVAQHHPAGRHEHHHHRRGRQRQGRRPRRPLSRRQPDLVGAGRRGARRGAGRRRPHPAGDRGPRRGRRGRDGRAGPLVPAPGAHRGSRRPRRRRERLAAPGAPVADRHGLGDCWAGASEAAAARPASRARSPERPPAQPAPGGATAPEPRRGSATARPPCRDR